MVVVLSRLRIPVVSMASRAAHGWFTWGRRACRRVWVRRNLTPQERAYLLASYTRPALITASLGGHVG
ncbi:hypothetical protein [Mycolicibacterium sp. 050158]|uniref:hypothetical protein n=1 Tax=Mycolicibacterium sp. 050158 TaxID=3090602 RepID=UPI00299EE3CA|nr:hypothetical protein [Mycolicibacterium sp. 050158]MDX1893410.1 hypothetical protein [Mycolicibacterium sp. 050158]